MKKIFISYHHLREQEEKNQLSELIKKNAYYLNVKDMSVKIGDINTKWSNNVIAKIIREKYLKDTNITILILGTHTKCRQHIDWEIESSLTKYGSLNRRNKINSLIILLTNDFINQNKNNQYLNYNELITQENAGLRIYETVINKYAIVDSYDEIFYNIKKLKEILEKVEFNQKKEENFYQNIISPYFLKSEILQKNNEENKINYELKEINIKEDKNFKRWNIHKLNNSEQCKPKLSNELTNFDFYKNNYIEGYKKTFEIFKKNEFNNKNINKINKLSKNIENNKNLILKNSI